uniref:Ubiquitin-like domain-containing protein n=1 Tax=Kalanchoe fedtschenkoi TaxID=63787 RepID=A0A7N0RF96_KALFE
MEISIHAHHNLEIRLEISHFDTVANIKQKIQSLTGIAASRQTLFFNNALLQDDADVERCNLFDNSRIRLLIRSPVAAESMKDPARVLVRNPISKRHVTVEAALECSVSRLKQSIAESERVAAELFTLFLFGREMDEEAEVRAFPGLGRDDAVVEMVLVFGGTRNNCSSGATAKVLVAVVAANVKLTITVTLSHSFGELRRELERLRKEGKVALPESWIFVFRKEKVMIENAALEKFKVVVGDVIQVHPFAFENAV